MRLAFCIWLAAGNALHAQEAPPAEPAAVRYAIPDLAAGRQLLPDIRTRFVDADLGLELIGDHTSFGQDEASLRQVGVQSDTFELRSAAINIAGRFGPQKRLRYRAGIEYNGFNVDTDQNFSITDLAVSVDFDRLNTRISVGEIRERFSYEVIGSTATMPQSERILSPFAPSHNAGIMAQHSFGEAQRMTLSYGFYRDDWGFGDGRLGVSARFTRLVVDEPGRFLHLGVSARRAGTDGTTRYRARPGVAAADSFLDTDVFPAQSALHLGLEGQFAAGPFTVLAEVATAGVRSAEAGNPRFHGYYVIGSWVLTGESRPYDRATGVVRRIVPTGRWGAPELVVRYAGMDLDSKDIRGGSYQRLEAGVNWWATTRWRLSLTGGRVWLDRFGERGVTDSLLTRLQWVY